MNEQVDLVESDLADAELAGDRTQRGEGALEQRHRTVPPRRAVAYAWLIVSGRPITSNA